MIEKIKHLLKSIFKSELLCYTGNPEWTPVSIGVRCKGTFPPIGSVYKYGDIKYVITKHKRNPNQYSAHPWTIWRYKK